MGLGAIGLQDRVATAAQPAEQDVGVNPVGFQQNVKILPLVYELPIPDSWFVSSN